jgi:hypothetical protein
MRRGVVFILFFLYPGFISNTNRNREDKKMTFSYNDREDMREAVKTIKSFAQNNGFFVEWSEEIDGDVPSELLDIFRQIDSTIGDLDVFAGRALVVFEDIDRD